MNRAGTRQVMTCAERYSIRPSTPPCCISTELSKPPYLFLICALPQVLAEKKDDHRAHLLIHPGPTRSAVLSRFRSRAATSSFSSDFLTASTSEE